MLYNYKIDNLRAIAVIAVIIYHSKISVFNNNLMSGGYIGVDIFFVISGYLMSRILLQELYLTKKINFFSFFERRVKRIVPVLLFVVLASLPFAFLILHNSNLINFLETSIASLTFLSNYYFYFTNFEYGNVNQLLKPLLHTWSLSVEIQFYILFPVFLLIIKKFFNAKYILCILSFLILSYLLSIILFLKIPYLNFYFLPSRGWEFLMGSIVAYVHLKKRNKQNRYISYSKFFVYSSLCLIFFSFFFFDENSLYSLHLKIIPLVATCCIIFFSEEEIKKQKLTSSFNLSYVGKISYSLYLWHFPIFSFLRLYKEKDLSLFEIFICVCLTFVLSILTYFFVEKKFRKKSSYLNFIIIASFLTMLSIMFLLHNAYKKHIPSPFSGIYDSNKNNCFGQRCVFNNGYEKKVYLIGDSTTAPILWYLKEASLSENFQLISYIEGGCIFAPDFDKYNKKTQKKDPSCNNDYFNQILNDVYSNPNSIIIIGGNYNEYLSGGIPSNDIYKPSGNNEKQSLSSSLKKILEKLSKTNQILLIYPAPLVADQAIVRNLSTLTNYNIKNVLIEEYLKFNAPAIGLFKEIEDKNIIKISVKDIFCNDTDGYCYVGDDKGFYYWDGFHISKYGALKIYEKLIKIIKQIYKID
jgi:peptidoglycan/LPS O-acetylase OafA/YrhL